MLLEGRVAFVTGAASGLGRAIAGRFAEEGARIAALDRDPAAGEALLAELPAVAGGDHLLVHADVRDAAAVDAAVGSIVAQAGRIDIAVHCAGVREIGDVYTMPAEEWDTVLAINLSGTFYCCQAVARRMRETGGGSIVNMASVGGLIGLSHRPAYTAAKHGVVGLTKSLARDLAADGIRVNALCPGVIRTPLTEQYFADDGFEQELAVHVPLARAGVPEDVAGAALYLASDQSSYVSGIALTIDGGWLAEKSFVSGRRAGLGLPRPSRRRRRLRRRASGVAQPNETVRFDARACRRARPSRPASAPTPRGRPRSLPSPKVTRGSSDER